MIGRISGRLDHKGSDHVLIDVGGVGYVVYCSERSLAALPNPGAQVALYTELLVREDLLQLFGFLSPYERDWHRLLTSVQGVGAKASMAILSALGAEGVARAVSLGDWGSVKAAQGVGPKLAQRVVNELKDKAPAVMALAGAQSGGQDGPEAGTQAGTQAGGQAGPLVEPDAPGGAASATGMDGSSPQPAPAGGGGPSAATQAEALSALTNLGYPPQEASAAVARAAAEGEAGEATADLIRAALRALAPKE